MLTLPIKKKWFDMIKSGEKKEEYREIKWYWTKSIYESDSKYARVWLVHATGYLSSTSVGSSLGVRPSVSLPIKILKENSNKN